MSSTDMESPQANNQIEAQYRDIVESQTDLICRFLPEGTLTFVNAAFCKHYQKTRDQLVGSNYLDLLSEERRGSLRAKMPTLRPDAPLTTTEIAKRISGEDTYWQLWSDLGIFDDQGNLIEIQSVGHDITDRRLAVIAAEGYAREMDALNKATTALLQTLDLESLLGHILDAAVGAIPHTEKAELHLIARDTGKLEMRAVLGFADTDPRIQKMVNPDDMGVAARVIRERVPIMIDDISDLEPPSVSKSQTAKQSSEQTAKQSAQQTVKQSSKKTAKQSSIIAPLLLGNHVLGAISLQTSHPVTFTKADLRLLTSFAATATTAIHNAQLHSSVQILAITDELTGLYNRRGFREFGEREIQRKLRYERELAVILMDMDNLKPINDDYGHSAGDRALCFVADKCITNTRKIDIVARYGGDEFAILLPETDLFAAATVAERLRAGIAGKPMIYDGNPIQITVSLGVSKMIAETNTLESLIARADQALYSAKQAGKNRVEVR